MIIEVTDKPEDFEGATFADSAVIDQGGVDLHFNDGRVYSANWGQHLPEDVAMAIVEVAFDETDVSDRGLIARTMREFADKLERNINKKEV